MAKPSYQISKSSTGLVLGLAIAAIVLVHHEALGYDEATATFISDRVFYLALTWIVGKRALDLVTKGGSSSATPDEEEPKA